MEGWIKWVGEVVWRLTSWPAGVKGNEGEENFWYRTYGVGSLILALITAVWLVGKVPEPISKLVALATTYNGADKPLAQGYIGVLLVLIVGVPTLIFGVFLLATLIAVGGSLVVVLSKGLGLAIRWAVSKYKKNHPTAVEPARERTFLSLISDWIAGTYQARSRGKHETVASAQVSEIPHTPTDPSRCIGATSERHLG